MKSIIQPQIIGMALEFRARDVRSKVRVGMGIWFHMAGSSHGSS